MAYLKNITKILVSALGCATLVAPCVVQARDVSLPMYSKDAQLTAYHSAVALETNGHDAGEEMFTEILSINEMDIWSRIRSGFKMPELDNPLVATHMGYYSRNPENFQRIAKRASKYLFHIVQECDKRGMPMELALLPFIESAYNPTARSSAKAEGLWQFIPSTGRDYDLAQNSFQDERRNIVASTDAALTYLQRLYDMFGDWHLALVSYNWGEGSVSRAIRKAEAAGRPTDFNSLSIYMPNEARNYVPKLLAVKNLVANPRAYNIALPAIDNQPYFVTIGKTRDIDVSVAAHLANMSESEFLSLNPQFKTKVIAGGDRVNIILPKRNAEYFRYNIARWTAPLSSWTAYQVTDSSESLSSIAEKYNTSPSVIRLANNIPAGHAVKSGSVILVPKPADMDEDISPDLVANAQIRLERDWRRDSSQIRLAKNNSDSNQVALALINDNISKRMNKATGNVNVRLRETPIASVRQHSDVKIVQARTSNHRVHTTIQPAVVTMSGSRLTKPRATVASLSSERPTSFVASRNQKAGKITSVTYGRKQEVTKKTNAKKTTEKQLAKASAKAPSKATSKTASKTNVKTVSYNDSKQRSSAKSKKNTIGNKISRKS